MKTIIFCNPKENIEMIVPNWVYLIIEPVIEHIKVKTVKISNGRKINLVSLDEAKNYENKTR